MTEKSWQVVKVRYCDHAGDEVALEAEMVYPAEFLPDQSPRLLNHRCSHAKECMLKTKPTCMWTGTNPTYDPFEG